MDRSLRPIAVAFVALGTFIGAWAVVSADIEHALGLGDGGFGLLLAVGLSATAVVGAATGTYIERWGVTRILAVGTSLFAVGVVVLAVSADRLPFLAFAATIVAIYGCSGIVDVAMNVAATSVLADQPGRLVRFHAFFNAGAALGAGITALVVHATDRWRLAFVVPTVAMAVAAVLCARSHVPVGESGEHHGMLHALRSVRANGLVLLALVFACGAMVEGGIDTWGVLVLRKQLAVGILVGAGAQAIGQAVAATSRAVLGPAAGSLGTTRGLAIGGGLAAGGLLLVAVAPAPLAVVGLVAGAAGVSVCWPMLLAHATTGTDGVAGVVSGLTSIGYLGFVLGPVLVGAVSEVAGLRNALLLLAAAAIVVAVAPRWLAPTATRAPLDEIGT